MLPATVNQVVYVPTPTYGYNYTYPVTYYAAGHAPLNATAAAGYTHTYPVTYSAIMSVANPKDKGRPQLRLP